MCEDILDVGLHLLKIYIWVPHHFAYIFLLVYVCWTEKRPLNFCVNKAVQHHPCQKQLTCKRHWNKDYGYHCIIYITVWHTLCINSQPSSFSSHCLWNTAIEHYVTDCFLETPQDSSVLQSFLPLRPPSPVVSVQWLHHSTSTYIIPGPRLRSMLSDAQLFPSGNRYLHSSPTATLWWPSNFRGWKHLFCLAFDCSVHVWPHPMPTSASEVTILRSFINQFIIIFLNVKSNYFIVRPKVDQRAGLLSLPHLRIFAIHTR